MPPPLVITQRLPVPARQLLTTLQEKIAPLLLLAGSAGVAYAAAQAALFGALHPLALCFAVSVLAPYSLCACAGAVVGYLTCLPLEAAVPYLAAVLASALARVIAAPHRQKISPLMPAVTGALCYFVTATGLAVLSQQGAAAMLRVACETVLVLALSFLLVAYFSARQKLPWLAKTNQSAAGALVLFFLLLCCCAPYAPYGVSLLVAGGAFGGLLLALLGRSPYAAASAIVTCVATAACAPQQLYAAVGVAAACLAAGYCMAAGKLFAIVGFLAAGLLAVPLAPSSAAGLMHMALLCVSAALAGAMPLRWLPQEQTLTSLQNRASLVTLSDKLERFSGALSDVGGTLQAVTARMPQQTEQYADVCDRVTELVCRRCTRCSTCWGSEGSDVYDAFNNLQATLERIGGVTAADLPQPLKDDCQHPQRLATTLSTAYNQYLARRASLARAKLMRDAVMEQYAALAAALSQLSVQVYREDVPDKRRAHRLEQLFVELGVEPFETLVATDAVGRLYANIRLPRLAFTQEELLAISKEASQLCRCRFSPATVRQTAGSSLVTLVQAPQFLPEFAVTALPADGKICADAVKTFLDANDCAHVLLCDGMGTGKAAAVDGALSAALAQQLLSAGFGVQETSRLVNIALSLKSDAESGAAIDALSINLFSGRAQIYKAGAAVSYLLRQGVVTLLGGESLPLGILDSVKSRCEQLQLQTGDMLILASDGATGENPDWICTELALCEETSPQILADALAEKAKARAARADDITVVCVHMQAQPQNGARVERTRGNVRQNKS